MPMNSDTRVVIMLPAYNAAETLETTYSPAAGLTPWD